MFAVLGFARRAQRLAHVHRFSTRAKAGLPPASYLAGVVVGLVEDVAAHPNADKLTVCTVRTGPAGDDSALRSIICGGKRFASSQPRFGQRTPCNLSWLAKNVAANQRVAVAVPGAKLDVPNVQSKSVGKLEKSGLKIRKSKIRGQLSEGMICSLGELGFADAGEGIWELPESVVAETGEELREEWLKPYDTLEAARIPFENVCSVWAKARDLQTCEGLLAWDLHTNVPQDARERRGEVASTLGELRHGLTTSAEYGVKLDAAMERLNTLNVSEKYSCQRAKEVYERERAVPSELVVEHAIRRAKCLERWGKAKEKGKFSVVASALQDLVDVSIEIEQRKMGDNSDGERSTYDSMLQTYVRGFGEDEIGELFGQLKMELSDIRNGIHSQWLSSEGPWNSKDTFPEHAQQDLSEYVSKALLSTQMTTRARLDTGVGATTHPTTFPVDPPVDVRITTTFDVNDPTSGLMATIHEAGHALYELGLPSSELPAAASLDMMTHESQALLWERMVGQSKGFWKFLAPRMLQNLGYGTGLGSATAEELYIACNRVGPGLIRVLADEVHYPLHVIVRFEIERDLINGKMKVKDIPERWAALYQELLGRTPSSDTEGCLQDIHWFYGLYGYFPTYALGAMFATQQFQAIQRNHPMLQDEIENGDFGTVKSWLQKNIWSVGSLPNSSKALCQNACGEDFASHNFLTYIREKYM